MKSIAQSITQAERSNHDPEKFDPFQMMINIL